MCLVIAFFVATAQLLSERFEEAASTTARALKLVRETGQAAPLVTLLGVRTMALLQLLELDAAATEAEATEDAARRDKKQLWILYTQAKREGISDEEIHGILFWQVKAMLLAARSKDAGAAGLNPFVYSKSKGFLKNFEEKEVENISSSLVTLYHDSRRGKHRALKCA